MRRRFKGLIIYDVIIFINFLKIDRVFYFFRQDCYHVPQGISLKECSALLDGYITALLGLVRRGKLEEGETVLVTAAGGGVGLAAVDLAANVYKAKVN